jgi:hypothetical protein
MTEEIPPCSNGANYADAAHQDEVYPGDERVRGRQGLTIQIHTLEVREKNRGPVIANMAPAVRCGFQQRCVETGWFRKTPDTA